MLGKIPSGLFIITARHGDRETGMLASWIMQAGFEPPMISLAVRKDRYLVDWLTTGATVVVNVLADGQKEMLRHFGKGFEPDEPAFDGIELARSPQGVPVLAHSAGHLECAIRRHVDSGDHRIFLAEVVGGHAAGDQPPAVHVRKNGLRY